MIDYTSSFLQKTELPLFDRGCTCSAPLPMKTAGDVHRRALGFSDLQGRPYKAYLEELFWGNHKILTMSSAAG